MQTISAPYRCSDTEHASIANLRRIYSAAVRTSYANARDERGGFLKQKDLRDLVKARFAGGVADAWILHCATLEGMEARRRVPDGSLVFGGRKNLLRRNNGMIESGEWREKRMLPLASRGDKNYRGNRHFRLAPDARSCTFRMYGRRVDMQLPRMSGNAGEIMRQAAALAASKLINVMFRIDATHLHMTIDPMDLPDHPERRRPVAAISGRAIGIDLNPQSIGVAAVGNRTNPAAIEGTSLLDYVLADTSLPIGASNETVREMLAATCDRIIGMARKHRAGLIVLEKGLGKLRSSGKNRSLNRVNNYWTRTVLLYMLTRKARLCGLKVMEVWAGYSTTIGNLAFEAPDACASAAEIGRRGLALSSGVKDVLPAMASEVVHRRWKDDELPRAVHDALRRSTTWGELHRSIKTAKLGVRRPHPRRSADFDGPAASLLGHAVRRLGLKHRPGWIYRPAPVPLLEATA